MSFEKFQYHYNQLTRFYRLIKHMDPKNLLKKRWNIKITKKVFLIKGKALDYFFVLGVLIVLWDGVKLFFSFLRSICNKMLRIVQNIYGLPSDFFRNGQKPHVLRDYGLYNVAIWLNDSKNELGLMSMFLLQTRLFRHTVDLILWQLLDKID